MKEWIGIVTTWFNNYCDSFQNLSENQLSGFRIKREHSLRVAEISLALSEKLDWSVEDKKIAFVVGLLHDIGRFSQLMEYGTFDDAKSVDHAEQGVKILKHENLSNILTEADREVVFASILNHNKFKIHDDLTSRELMHSKVIRDADKIDIFKVLSDYYTKKPGNVNHTLSMELPKGTTVSPLVSRDVLAGKMVSKKNVISEVDVKVMQLSWVYDINFRPSFEYLVRNRCLESVYNSLPKNDLVIEIYRKIKVFAENKIMSNS